MTEITPHNVSQAGVNSTDDPILDAEFTDRPNSNSNWHSDSGIEDEDGLDVPLTQDEMDDFAHRQVREFNPGLQRIVLPENATQADAIIILAKSVPQNEFGLPAFFYRSDCLPALGELTQIGADSAIVHLDYDEGFPTFSGGKIWWYQLPHEPMEAHMCFRRYLDQVEDVGLRQLQLLSMEEHKSFETLQGWAAEYYWQARARAYDLFQVAAERKRREARARKSENAHFAIAEGLLEPLKDKMNAPEFWDNLEAKEAIDILRQLINIQRISLGLAANGNSGREAFNPDGAKTGAQLIRQVADGQGIQEEGLGLDGGLLKLMQDPSFAFEAQKLVVRVRYAGAEQQASETKITDEEF